MRAWSEAQFNNALSESWSSAPRSSDPSRPQRNNRTSTDTTLARVIRLLPRPPEKVVMIDADTSGQSLHDKLQHVEGFVNPGRRVVYLVRQSDTLQRAMKGPGIFDYALALTIWHEMAHIDGADEATARRAEEQLWTEFVVAGPRGQSPGDEVSGAPEGPP